MVEVRDVTKRFDDFVALDRVSLDIAEGEFMTFLGPSGCGKTTFLRCIAGLEVPTDGTLSVNGMTPDQARRARRVGLSPRGGHPGAFITVLGYAAGLAMPWTAGSLGGFHCGRSLAAAPGC